MSYFSHLDETPPRTHSSLFGHLHSIHTYTVYYVWLDETVENHSPTRPSPDLLRALRHPVRYVCLSVILNYTTPYTKYYIHTMRSSSGAHIPYAVQHIHDIYIYDGLHIKLISGSTESTRRSKDAARKERYKKKQQREKRYFLDRNEKAVFIFYFFFLSLSQRSTIRPNFLRELISW